MRRGFLSKKTNESLEICSQTM